MPSLWVAPLLSSCLCLIVVGLSATVDGCASDQLEVSKAAFDKGKVTIAIKSITLTQFCDSKNKFAEVVAHYASVHCKKRADNCATNEDHIRSDDVVRESVSSPANADLQVRIYIREITNFDQAALTTVQLETVFKEYGGSINTEYGYQVTVLNPSSSGGFEPWRIAVITVLSVLAAVCVLVIIVLLVQARRRAIRANEMASQNRPTDRSMAEYDNVQISNAGVSTYESLQSANGVSPEYSALSPDVHLGAPLTPPAFKTPEPTFSTFSPLNKDNATTQDPKKESKEMHAYANPIYPTLPSNSNNEVTEL